jgi:hypothetical protein
MACALAAVTWFAAAMHVSTAYVVGGILADVPAA